MEIKGKIEEIPLDLLVDRDLNVRREIDPEKRQALIVASNVMA